MDVNKFTTFNPPTPFDEVYVEKTGEENAADNETQVCVKKKNSNSFLT